MESIKKARIKHPDGSYTDNVPIGADAQDVIMKDGTNVEDNINEIKKELAKIKEILRGLS